MLPRHSYSHYGPPPGRGGRRAGGLAAAVSDDKIVVAELIPMMSYFSSLPTTMYYHWIHNTVDNSFFYPLKDFDSLFTFWLFLIYYIDLFPSSILAIAKISYKPQFFSTEFW